VQVDPIKPKLKLPGSKHLKLKYDKPLSNFAFTFNLRRYSMATQVGRRGDERWEEFRKVGRCRFTLPKPTLKAPGTRL
jgi:hypothetical protein